MELWDSEVTGFVPSAEPFSFRHLVENRLPQKRGTLWGRGEGGKAGDGGRGGGVALPVRDATLAAGRKFWALSPNADSLTPRT